MTLFFQDPSEILDYKGNLVTDDSDTIASATWSAPGLTVTATSNTTTTATARISAVGAAVGSYVATVHLVGVSGQQYEQSIQIRVVQK